MELENIWQHKGERDNDLEILFDNGRFRKQVSRLPLKKLRTHLLTGMVCAVFITTGYITGLFFIDLWQVNITLCVLIVFNTIIMIDGWNLYRKIPLTIMPSISLKEELTVQYTSFQRWWSIQQKISLFVYPIAVTGGFILGGFLGSGKPVEAFLYNTRILSILGITVLVTVPFFYFMARLMFNHAYGRHLKKIKKVIDELN